MGLATQESSPYFVGLVGLFVVLVPDQVLRAPVLSVVLGAFPGSGRTFSGRVGVSFFSRALRRTCFGLDWKCLPIWLPEYQHC